MFLEDSVTERVPELGRLVRQSLRKRRLAQSMPLSARRALSLYRALHLVGDRGGLAALLSYAGRPVEGRDFVTIGRADCEALATVLYQAGYPLDETGIARFKLERGFAESLQIGPELAQAYVRFANRCEARAVITEAQWTTLSRADRRAMRVLLWMGRDPVALADFRNTVGIIEPRSAGLGVVAVGASSTLQFRQWCENRGLRFDDEGLQHFRTHYKNIAHAAELDAVLAEFALDTAYARGEPTHDYRRVERNGHLLNQRTLTMLISVQSVIAPRRIVLLKGSYRSDEERGAHPHQGGGVVDLSVNAMPEQTIEALVAGLRSHGFAAWLRARHNPHIHAVSIGDRELSPAAHWQLGEHFAGRSGRVAPEPDPHAALEVELPDWVRRYRLRYI